MNRQIPGTVFFLTLVAGLFVGTRAHANSSSLMALAPDGRRLLTANADAHSLSVVDTDGRRLLREIKLSGEPQCVAWVGAGPKAVVTLYHEDKVALVDVDAGRVLRELVVDDEPYGIVVNRAATTAYVAHDYWGTVSEIDLGSFTVRRSLKSGPWSRGLALLPDEKRLLVTHFYTGVVSALDLASGTVVDRWEGAASDNYARHIALHPTQPLAYVPHIRSRVERAHGAGSIFPYVAILDLTPAAEGKRRRHVISMDSYVTVLVPCNPWETAIAPDGKRHYTIFAGTNDLFVSTVVNDGYRFLKPASRLIPVGSNPRAIAVSPDSRTVYIYNSLDYAVAIFQAEPFQKVGEVTVCDNPMSPDMHRGKVLFNLAKQPMSRQRWIACSSCHMDGDHDGRTWQNPEGLRRTVPFYAMARTYPIHWSADRDELQDFEHTIRGPLMQGRGLIPGEVADSLGEPNAGRSKDLDALAAYCNSFEPPRSPHALGPSKLSPAAERGKAIFFSAETRCATCHSGPEYTDGKVHDVGTGGDDPSELMGPKYDTPTLLRTYRNTMWLHHGKARSLEEVLTTQNRGDRHGKTSHLTPDQIRDLVAFLKSLPYE